MKISAMISNLKILSVFLIFELINNTAFAYPDFISYGYKSCTVCHYNGVGGGPLTDYGRSLFATEITARTFISDKTTDEQLAESSGFLGSTELPYWLRPGFKYRGLFLKSNLGSKESVDRFIQMQADVNLAVALDQKSDYLFVGSYGYVPTPARYKTSVTEKKPSNWISKEIYFRAKLVKNFWVYTGLMDKVFGIRHPDHTAFNKGINGFGLSQNDQTHAVMLHYAPKNYEIAAQYFAGNLSQTAELRQKGFTVMTEYFPTDGLSLGVSALQSKNEYIKWDRTALHSRISFAKGKSILAEFGTRKDTPLQSNTIDAKSGFYTYIQGLIGLNQGYNFLTTYQTYKDKLTSTGTTRNRLGTGILFFPWPRTEFRFEVINDRTTAQTNTSPDTWSGLAQVHLSW